MRLGSMTTVTSGSWIGSRRSSSRLARSSTPATSNERCSAHPAVADAGVVGVPAPGGGEVGVAFVVLAPAATATDDELRAFCRGRLAGHQVPGRITFVGELPRNAVGKLRRDELARLAARASVDGA